MMPSSGLWGHQAHTWYAYIHAITHKIKIVAEKKEKSSISPTKLNRMKIFFERGDTLGYFIKPGFSPSLVHRSREVRDLLGITNKRQSGLQRSIPEHKGHTFSYIELSILSKICSKREWENCKAFLRRLK